MSMRSLVLVNHDGWFQLAGGVFSEIPAWPKLSAQTLVVTDFNDTILGVHRFEGKLAYAVPMIEKHVRTQGLTDGDVHINLHWVDSVPGGCLAFYSAVPLALWQRLQSWADQQADHCMVVNLAGLLCDGLKSGQARIVRSGRSLHLVGRNPAGIFHCAADAIGKSGAELEAAVRALAVQSLANLAKSASQPVLWACVATEDLAAEALCAKVFSEQAQVDCQLYTHAELAGASGGAVLSALPALCEGLGWNAVEASTLRRLAWVSEQIVAPLAAVTLVVAAGLFGTTWVASHKAVKERDVAMQLQNQASAVEDRVAAANQMALPAGFAPVAAFARQLGDGAAYDPLLMLQLVQRAAGSQLRVQRIKLETLGENLKSFRVDGVSPNTGLADITVFLAELRASGWTAEPLDPLEQTPGAFSYRLNAAPKSPLPAGA